MTINCKGLLFDLNTPRIMGILNATPDSFYDGGNYRNETEILTRAEEILEQGADFIDVGGYSSKPNAEFVSEDQEISRLLPAINSIVKHFPDALISVDTFRSVAARACIEHGAAVINDISSGMLDDRMLSTVAQLKVPYIMMHMRGNPQNMQQLTEYDDVVKEMLFYFSERIAAARSHGISDLVIDPGFGFAKTLEQNYEVLKQLGLFEITGLPLLVGLSRKSMIYKSLGTSPAEALNGTTALHMMALGRGAKILRVHDVMQAMECVKLFELSK